MATKKLTGYKLAGKYHDHIVTLEFDPAQSNVNRKVFDSNHARYRCKEADVIDIRFILTNQQVEQVPSAFKEDFIYEIGKKIVEPKYNEDIDKVNTHGIHFYLTKETVEKIPNTQWYENGELKLELKPHPTDFLLKKSKRWHKNGQLMYETTLRNGCKSGEYNSYYDNGQQKYKYKKIMGVYEGEYKHYDSKGKLLLECTFNNGVLDGELVSYNSCNYKVMTRCNYSNGKPYDGKFYYTLLNGCEIEGCIKGNTIYHNKKPILRQQNAIIMDYLQSLNRQLAKF